jgi:DNA-binding transcriptional LysR family regulator
MDRLQSMRVFQEVADGGSFAAAARRLDLSPAVVTRLVSDLEASLGVRLLQRTTRHVSLTLSGAAYLERLRVILSDIDDAHAMVQAQNREIQGTLRIASNATTATHVLTPAIASFQRAHPAVHFEIVESDLPEASVEDVDIALVTGFAQVSADVILRQIFRSSTLVCASPNYLREQGTPIRPQDLRQHRWVRMRLGNERRPRPVRLVNPATGERTEDVQGQAVLIANGRDAVLRATILGAGISVQPLEIMAPQLQDGSLVSLMAPWTAEELRLSAALPSREYMPARTRAFLDHLAAFARELVSGLQEAQV